MTKLKMLRRAVLGSFWFIPSLATVLLSLAALAMLRVEGDGGLLSRAFLSELQVEGARAVLSTIAGGMMTVASIVFSLTFVALTTMSSQFGPRILMFFMNDRVTQIVLGLFVGSFLYALIVLLGTEQDARPPFAAVVGAMALAGLSFGVMIYFVHHIAQSIQADVLVARLGAKLTAAVEHLEAWRDQAAAIENWGGDRPDEAGVLRAPESGYVQLIDDAALVKAARKAEGRFEILFKAAEFVLKGEPLIRVYGGAQTARALAADELEPARWGVALGPLRTPAQNAHFEIAALTEVAVRALSPGVNDPNTAIACVHHLVAGLALISRRGVARDCVHEDEEGAPRVLERRRNFADFLDLAFAPIRANARSDALVCGALLEGYAKLSEAVEAPPDRQALREAVEGLREGLEEFELNERDRKALRRTAERVREGLG